MKRSLRSFAPCLVLLLVFLGGVASGQVPQTISYQGVLTDAAGVVLPDGNYNLTFRLYDLATGGTALWSEGQLVAVSKGIFNVILGSVVPLALPFDKPYWLGVTVETGPELAPRIALTAAPYSLRSANADSVNGIAASSTPTANKLFPLGSDAKFPASVLPPGLPPGPHGSTHNEGGSDVITVTSAVIQDGTIAGSDIDASTTITARKLEAVTTPGPLLGVYGVYGEAQSASALPLLWPSGVKGHAENTSSGSAFGGSFSTSSEGTGEHFGVEGAAYGASSAYACGVRGYGKNTSTGLALGGYFLTSSEGTGEHRAVMADARGASSAWVLGVLSYGLNSSSGRTYGGRFVAVSQGSGNHYGVVGIAYGAASAPVYGAYAYGENTSSGPAYGGYFSALASGSGVHYGVYAEEAAGGSGAAVYAAGDLVTSGAKNAVVRTSHGHRLLSVMESPEVWFEDFGRGQLVNGRAHVELDPLFLETVTINAEHPMEVFIQLRDDCKGTYVKTSSTGFDVFELQGGTSNASFSYRVVAKRKGYEGQRFEQTTVGEEDPTLYPELRTVMEKQFEEERKRDELARERQRDQEQRMEQLQEQGRLDGRQPPLQEKMRATPEQE